MSKLTFSQALCAEKFQGETVRVELLITAREAPTPRDGVREVTEYVARVTDGRTGEVKVEVVSRELWNGKGAFSKAAGAAFSVFCDRAEQAEDFEEFERLAEYCLQDEYVREGNRFYPPRAWQAVNGGQVPPKETWGSAVTERSFIKTATRRTAAG